MGEIKQFKLKDKKPNQVYEHNCGCQLWFVEELPEGRDKAGDKFEGLTVLRCFGCGEYIEASELLDTEDDE